MIEMLYWVDTSILYYFLLVNSFYGFLLFISIFELYKRYGEVGLEDLERILKSESVPPITVIAPAYNESENIIDSVRAILHLNYRKVHVIVVNDGSKDDTLDRLIKGYNLKQVPTAVPRRLKHKTIRAIYRSQSNPNLIVIDKENGGKADSLNAGINACQTPYFMAMDADTVIEKDALQRMIRPVLTKPNVIAACGSVRIANGCKIEHGILREVNFPRSYWAGIQVVEYLRAFLFGRLGWNMLGGNLVVSGAFGLFSRSAVLDIGGYMTDTVGEDMELTVRLHRHFRDLKKDYTIEFIPDPVVWTEAPENISILYRQRSRWHCGLIETLYKHKRMFMNPKYGMVGMISFPFFVLELLSPLIELTGYAFVIIGLYMGAVDLAFGFKLFLAAWAYSGILSLFAVLLEESSFHRYKNRWDPLFLYFSLLIENLGYRQITVFMRLMGFYKFLKKDLSWGDMQRKGLAKDNDIKEKEVA